MELWWFRAMLNEFKQRRSLLLTNKHKESHCYTRAFRAQLGVKCQITSKMRTKPEGKDIEIITKKTTTINKQTGFDGTQETSMTWTLSFWCLLCFRHKFSFLSEIRIFRIDFFLPCKIRYQFCRGHRNALYLQIVTFFVRALWVQHCFNLFAGRNCRLN